MLSFEDFYAEKFVVSGSVVYAADPIKRQHSSSMPMGFVTSMADAILRLLFSRCFAANIRLSLAPFYPYLGIVFESVALPKLIRQLEGSATVVPSSLSPAVDFLYMSGVFLYLFIY